MLKCLGFPFKELAYMIQELGVRVEVLRFKLHECHYLGVESTVCGNSFRVWGK